MNHSVIMPTENKLEEGIKNMTGNASNETLYTTDPVYRNAVDGLESSTKNYLEYYNNLSPEKKAAEVYFWQEFVSCLD